MMAGVLDRAWSDADRNDADRVVLVENPLIVGRRRQAIESGVPLDWIDSIHAEQCHSPIPPSAQKGMTWQGPFLLSSEASRGEPHLCDKDGNRDKLAKGIIAQPGMGPACAFGSKTR